MKSPNKAIQPDEEDEHHTLSQAREAATSNTPKLYGRREQRKASISSQNNISTVLLMTFLIVCVGIFTIRYLELKQKQNQSMISMQQTQQLIQERKDSTNMNHNPYQNDPNQPKIKNPYLDENIPPKKDQMPLMDQNEFSNTRQPSVSQEFEEKQQNSLQPRAKSEEVFADMGESMNEEMDSDEGKFDRREEIDEPSSGDLEEKGVKSIEEAELLGVKDNQRIDEEFMLHPKAFQLNAESSQSTTNQIYKPENQLHPNSVESDQFVRISPNNQINKIPKTQNINKFSDSASKQLQVPFSSQQSSQQVQPKPTMQLSQQDLYDPIIRVKDKVQANFNAKFQDLIYIKAGTNIQQDQYYKARERMSIWKYVNPSTGNIQLLSEVSYEPQVLSSVQSVQSQLQKIKKVITQQRQQYQKKYQTNLYQQIPFCIIIPSYKNQDKYMRNLNSILQQDYQNYHIIYIDDASQDGTADKVRAYIQKYNISEKRLNFIENKENKKALPNIDFAARRLCNSGEIMAIIDGDDYLIGTQVFKLINARYHKENLLALYTNHLRVHQPIYLKVGTCIDYPQRVKKSRSYRRFSIFPASHLRTFYVDLYWRINIRDLKDYRGQYFTAANDFAIMMPILEMASDRFEYLPQLTYVYDAGTGFNNFQTKADTQAKNFKITKRRHRYPKLVHDLPFLNQPASNENLDSNQSPGIKLMEMLATV